MSVKGPGGHRPHPSRDPLYYKGMIALMTGQPVEVKKPRKRPSGLTYNRQEDKDRPEIAKRMRRDRWELWRVEPYGKVGKKGFGWGDFWAHHRSQRMMGWVEAKSGTGTIQEIQKQRAADCYDCNVHYWFVRLEGEGYKMEAIG